MAESKVDLELEAQRRLSRAMDAAVRRLEEPGAAAGNAARTYAGFDRLAAALNARIGSPKPTAALIERPREDEQPPGDLQPPSMSGAQAERTAEAPRGFAPRFPPAPLPRSLQRPRPSGAIDAAVRRLEEPGAAAGNAAQTYAEFDRLAAALNANSAAVLLARIPFPLPAAGLGLLTGSAARERRSPPVLPPPIPYSFTPDSLGLLAARLSQAGRQFEAVGLQMPQALETMGLALTRAVRSLFERIDPAPHFPLSVDLRPLGQPQTLALRAAALQERLDGRLLPALDRLTLKLEELSGSLDRLAAPFPGTAAPAEEGFRDRYDRTMAMISAAGTIVTLGSRSSQLGKRLRQFARRKPGRNLSGGRGRPIPADDGKPFRPPGGPAKDIQLYGAHGRPVARASGRGPSGGSRSPIRRLRGAFARSSLLSARIDAAIGNLGGKILQAAKGPLAAGKGALTALKGVGRGIPALNAALGAASVASTLADDELTAAEKTREVSGAAGGLLASGLGATKGAMLGAALGSVVPGLGTAVGGAVGGLLGGAAGYFGGRAAGRGLAALLVSDEDEGASEKKPAPPQPASRGRSAAKCPPPCSFPQWPSPLR